MSELLKRATWHNDVVEKFDAVVFRAPHSGVKAELISLWQKYHEELAEFAVAYSKKYQASLDTGFSAAFGDIEGELLYILIREIKPEIVYEISPNSGCSTNYLLAAVTRNGIGRIEGFDIQASFNGVPTRDAIAKNQIAMCDFSRYNVHIGDARTTVTERLKTEVPDFCLIDSWHEDVFSEFYVHELFPKMKGTAIVQDIAHFDPRPEWSTEALHLLTHMQLTGTELVSIAAYEDYLNNSGIRNGLVSRRPMRSNSIVLQFGDGGAISPRLPNTRYYESLSGRVNEDSPAICDILAMWYGRATVSSRMADSLVRYFTNTDLCLQVLIVETLAKHQYQSRALKLLDLIDFKMLRGSELPLFLARAALLLNRIDIVDAMALVISDAASDSTIATRYRQLLELADVQYRCGHAKAAREAFERAISVLAVERHSAQKIGADLGSFCIRHPQHFSDLRRAGLSTSQAVRSTANAGKNLLRAAAARAKRRLRS